jgi:hypothetical protein
MGPATRRKEMQQLSEIKTTAMYLAKLFAFERVEHELK